MPTKCGECDEGFREKPLMGEPVTIGDTICPSIRWIKERCPVCGGTGWKKSSVWSKLSGT